MSSINPVLDRPGLGQSAGRPRPDGASASSPRSVALIPLRDATDGPLSVSRQRRTLAIYALMVAAGLALAFTAGSAGQA
ncbi:MAG TPA: hypothetical protein VNX47_07800, partial [Nevskia sp.]|nr:hypothetical protein [Nevskia sp.]